MHYSKYLFIIIYVCVYVVMGGLLSVCYLIQWIFWGYRISFMLECLLHIFSLML